MPPRGRQKGGRLPPQAFRPARLDCQHAPLYFLLSETFGLRFSRRFLVSESHGLCFSRRFLALESFELLLFGLNRIRESKTFLKVLHWASGSITNSTKGPFSLLI